MVIHYTLSVTNYCRMNIDKLKQQNVKYVCYLL